MHKAAVALSLITLISTQTFANQNNNVDFQPNNKHKGLYIEASGGTNAYYAGVISDHDDTNTAGTNGWGVSGSAGYFFNQYVAVETGLIHSEISGVDSEDDHDKKYQLTAKSNIPYLSARFSVPIGDNFEFISKIGGMYFSSNTVKVYENGKEEKSDLKDKDENIALILPYVGLGVGYNVTKNLEISAQYQGAVYGIAGAGLLSGGLTYHFA